MSMRWPVAQDYNEAVQSPSLCFADPELRAGTAKTNLYGLPHQRSGAFASVFKLVREGQAHAVRCFLRRMDGLQERYEAIAAHLAAHQVKCLTYFDFFPDGIRVKGAWFPVLKMPWLEGQHLDSWIRENLHRPEAIRDLARQWLEVLEELRQAGVAHGDLQHGNILVDPAGLIFLVDYDGMFVPALRGHKVQEQGHRNYQHPGRTQAVFGPQLDHFSGWLIYFSLLAISEDPALWQRHGDGDDALLLKQRDLLNPGRGRAWADLDHHFFQDKSLAMWLRDFLQTPVENIPPVSTATSSDWQRDLPWWSSEEAKAAPPIPSLKEPAWQPNAAFVQEITTLQASIYQLPTPVLKTLDPMEEAPPPMLPAPLPPHLTPFKQVAKTEWTQREEKSDNWLFYLGAVLSGSSILYGCFNSLREDWISPLIPFLTGLLCMSQGPTFVKGEDCAVEKITEEENPDYRWHLEQRQAAEQAASGQLRQITASVGAFHEQFPGAFAREWGKCLVQIEKILLRLQTAPEDRLAENRKLQKGTASGTSPAITPPGEFAAQLRARGVVQQALERKRLFFDSVPDWEAEFRAKVDQDLNPETMEMEYAPIPMESFDWREEDNVLVGQARVAVQRFNAWVERQLTIAKWEDARLLAAIWTTAKARADLSAFPGPGQASPASFASSFMQ